MPDDAAVHRLLFAHREWPQRFGQQLDRLDADRRLPRPCPEDWSSDADHVAEVEPCEQGVGIAEGVLAEVELDLAALVGEMRERRLAVPAPRHHPPRRRHDRPLLGALRQRGARFGCRVRASEPVRERLDARRDQRVELGAPVAEDEVEILACAVDRGHAAAVPFAPPARRTEALRYASMNGSIPPSITFWTSGILSSVRWSLTIVYGWKT